MRLFNGDLLAAHQMSNLLSLCRSCHKHVEWHLDVGVRLATENPRAFEALIDGTLDRGEKVDSRQQDLFGVGK